MKRIFFLLTMLICLVIPMTSSTISATDVSFPIFKRYYLYGGPDRSVFLGCINSKRFDSKFIWNFIGDYSSRYSKTSIWNKYGDYGSKYSKLSPWNKYSDSAPAVIDERGNFHGHFSINKYHPKRTRLDFCRYILDNYNNIITDPKGFREEIGM